MCILLLISYEIATISGHAVKLPSSMLTNQTATCILYIFSKCPQYKPNIYHNLHTSELYK